jgi:predicted MFS family arabinose efflux permease
VLGRFPGLGKLTAGSLLSETADQFSLVAIIWVTLVETGSPALAGLTVMFRRAPEIISGPVLGAWFDRLPPIRLTAIGFLIRGLALAVIGLIALVAFNIWVVLAVCVIMGVTNPLAKVGTRVITPRLIPKGDLQVANGVLTIGDQFPYLVGPVLGGALAGLLGGWSLLVPTVLCTVATILIVRVRLPQENAPKQAPVRTSRMIRNGLVAGFRPMVTIPVVRAMMILTVIYFISYGPLLTAIPMFAKDQLHTGGAGYGAMWSAMGIGAVAGLVTIPWLSRFRPAVVNSVGAVLWGLVLLPLVLVTSLPLALVIMFVGGFIWAPYASTEISVIQDAVPAAQHGAVFGAQRSVIVASSPTGAALGGFLLLSLSASQVVAMSALACVVGGLCVLALPSVRRSRPLAAADRAGEPEPTAPATAA